MSEFKVIETQEDFDNAIKNRLERENKKYQTLQAEYDNLKSENEKLQTNYTSLNESAQQSADKIAELENKLKANETDSVKTEIALKNGIPYNAISFIQGETEDEILDSVNKLKDLMNTNNTVYAKKSTEPEMAEDTDVTRSELTKTVRNIRN